MGARLLPLDGSGTTWQDGISSLAVPNPGDTEPVRKVIDSVLNRTEDMHEQRPDAIAWLRRDAPAAADRA